MLAAVNGVYCVLPCVATSPSLQSYSPWRFSTCIGTIYSAQCVTLLIDDESLLTSHVRQNVLLAAQVRCSMTRHSPYQHNLSVRPDPPEVIARDSIHNNHYENVRVRLITRFSLSYAKALIKGCDLSKCHS